MFIFSIYKKLRKTIYMENSFLLFTKVFLFVINFHPQYYLYLHISVKLELISFIANSKVTLCYSGFSCLKSHLVAS